MEKLGCVELSLIFNKFDNPNDKLSFSKVSKQFLVVSCFYNPRLRSVPASCFFDILYNWLPDILTSFPNLIKFYCSKLLSNNHMKLLAESCPNLLMLSLPLKTVGDFVFDFNDDGLCAVANVCNRLCTVNLSGRLHVGDVGICSLITSCKNLSVLELGGCVGVADESLKAIGKSTCRLDHLVLKGCYLITDMGLKYLANGDLKNSLCVFDLSECDRISDDGIIHLKQMVNLDYLNLSKCGVNVTDAGIVELVAQLWFLTYLNLGGCVGVTDETLKAIGKSTRRLYRLVLKGCYLITDLGLKYLANGDLKNSLGEIDLSECDSISDDGIIHLKQMINLRDLNLSKCGVNVTDAGIVELVSQLLFLRFLNLSWLINVTDISLPVIAIECSKLERLDLSGCEAITVEGLFAFAINPWLELLVLYSCHNISQEDMKSLYSTCRSLRYVKLDK